MKRILAAAILALAVAGCAVTGAAFGPSPEAQIATGASAVTAAATLGTVLLKNAKITVAQAKSYRAILGSASSHLDVANAALLDCRSKTASTSRTAPDPCAPKVADDIALALSIAGDVNRTLSAK